MNSKPSPPLADTAPVVQIRPLQARRERLRQSRVDRYNEVVELSREGMSQLAISQKLHMGRKTIRRFLRANQFPERATPRRSPPSVNKFQEFLHRRWNEGCHNATQLWHEIQTQGFTGSRNSMSGLVATLRMRGSKYFRNIATPRQQRVKPPSPLRTIAEFRIMPSGFGDRQRGSDFSIVYSA